jgi:hypothetical protein
MARLTPERPIRIFEANVDAPAVERMTPPVMRM